MKVAAKIVALETMLWCTIVAACSCLILVQASEDSPKIIIVGAGVSGISAASRLLQNGFKDVTLLEAENRIGGRVHTQIFGGYMVDLGAQWVEGEKGNVAYELAWPLGLIGHSHPPAEEKFLSSSDPPIPKKTLEETLDLFFSITSIPEEYANKSFGDYIMTRYTEYFKAHPDITAAQQSSILHMLNSISMNYNGADNWYDVSGRDDDIECEGDQLMNWKDKGYSTILDILMKKIPNPAEELPVRKHTFLNTEVSQIDYSNPNGEVRVVTANGNEYTADHVIVTTSIGVLKADHKTMFNPQLPDIKINTMKGLQLGNVEKLFLSYYEPWWMDENGTFNSSFALYWTPEDRIAIANDPDKSWMLGLSEVTVVEHKPRLLLCSISGPAARQMGTIPVYRLFNQVNELFYRFFGKTYNLTQPAALIWTNWASNKHFRGSWSFRNPEFVRSGLNITDLSDPIIKNGKPVILFAGEVTDPTHFSSVHGAISSGWREAERLQKFYDDRESTTATN